MFNNPFTNRSQPSPPKHNDLSLQEVGLLLQDTAYAQPSMVCYICKAVPLYKLVAKHAHLASVELDKIGYVCQGCVSKIDVTQYRTIKLEGR